MTCTSNRVAIGSAVAILLLGALAVATGWDGPTLWVAFFALVAFGTIAGTRARKGC